nr:spondin-1-like [Oncorhynchus nerka]
MAGAGIFLCILLLQCFISTALCNAGFAFTEEPSERAGKSDGYCGRILRAQGTRKEGYNEFRLRVEGDPENYQPGSTYRVTLYASSPAYFRGFTLIALREGRGGDKEEDYAGNFQIIDEEDTQFMINCPSAVTESTPRRRTRIQVFWTAPPSASGCVTLKASIVQKRIIYFQDEGSLTKRMCEKESLYGETTEKPLLDCCACGTAKYRVTFHGNWSEKVHPKDYPRRANHWSAIIGASHSKNYVLWEYGGYASEGIKKVAELGSPVSMEEEIRQKGSGAALSSFVQDFPTLRKIVDCKEDKDSTQPLRSPQAPQQQDHPPPCLPTTTRAKTTLPSAC